MKNSRSFRDEIESANASILSSNNSDDSDNTDSESNGIKSTASDLITFDNQKSVTIFFSKLEFFSCV